jgi:hypothetical protein
MSTKRHPIGSVVFILAAVAPLSNGCRSAAFEHAARQGTLSDLSKSVNEARNRGNFSYDDLKKLAYAVAEREIRTAVDPKGNGELEDPSFSELSPCATALAPLLEQRSKQDDDTGASAQFSLIEAGFPISTKTWHTLQSSRFGWARASAARASLEPERFVYREQALADGDPRVRRAALTSCIEAPAKQHYASIITLLRGDPDTTSRGLAARAVGVLGGDDAFRSLVDVFPRADESLRLAVVNAFAERPTFDAGGRERLIALALSHPGLVGIAAAVSLAKGTSNAVDIGHNRITLALTTGSAEEQRLALSAAIWSRPEQSERLVRLGFPENDPVVRVTALGRWLERTNHSWPATMTLRTLSESDSPEALVARRLLAQNRDWSIAKYLAAQQGYANAEARYLAAESLLLLGDWSGVARTLADDSPALRMKTACLVLSSQ